MAYQSARLDDLEIFVAVVDAGGFTAAARVTGARKARLSRRVQELERGLGARLLERTTRTIRLTEVGATFYRRAAAAVASARAAASAVATSRREPAGTLRISTTQLLAEMLLEPVALAYLARFPEVSVEVEVSSRPVDLVREGFDLALRVGPSPTSALRSRTLGQGRALYVASPAYLQAQGSLLRPAEVSRHAAVAVQGGPPDWPFERRARRLAVAPRVRLLTPSYTLARRAVCAGLGLGRLPAFFVAEALASGSLQTVLDDWTPPPVPIVAVFPRSAHLALTTRTFLDALTGHLRLHPLATAG